MRLPSRQALFNPASLTLGTILLVLGLFWVGVPLLDQIELRTYDLRFRARGPVAPSEAVVMAVIDEKSLDAEGRWPWPRSKVAALVDSLSRDGARVVGFDIGLSEPDENSQLAFLDELAKKIAALPGKSPELDEFIRQSRIRADNDLALAAAIRRSSVPVVLGYFFHMDEGTLNYRLEPREIEERIGRIGASKYPFVSYRTVDAGAVPFIKKAYAPESNLPLFTEAAAASGHFTVMNDPDGVVRWVPLVIQAGDDVFPPLSLLAAWHYLGRPRLTATVGRHGVEGIRLGERAIPVDESGQLLVRYLGPEKTFPHVSVTDVLKGKVPDGTFKDRIVLVGATAMGLYDLRNTPFSPVYPGLEIHATVIDNVLTGQLMSRPRWSKIYDVLAIIGLASLIGVVFPRMRALRGLVVGAALFAGYVLAALWLFVAFGVWLDMVYPLLSLGVNYTALTAYRYATEERKRKKIKQTIQHYVAPLVVEEMLKDPTRLRLGGEERVLTVLFSDLEGFTSYSERYAPSEMIELLSEYFGRMTEAVFAHQGTLKEYVGDELMAIFGAPLEQPDHAARACAAALAMRAQRRAMNDEWAKVGRPRLRARTGVNSGPMLAGNLGSKYRFAYGVLGDQVNLGSRLEGLNKPYGTEILVGENTARLVEGSFLMREVDMVRVKGKRQPVRVYELLARSDEGIPPEQEKAVSVYAAGLEAYRQQRWDEALGLFAQTLTLWPEDGPSRTMAERCEINKRTPPPEDWDGVFESLSAFKG
jgi:adenylate cyclase